MWGAVRAMRSGQNRRGAGNPGCGAGSAGPGAGSAVQVGAVQCGEGQCSARRRAGSAGPAAEPPHARGSSTGSGGARAGAARPPPQPRPLRARTPRYFDGQLGLPALLPADLPRPPAEPRAPRPPIGQLRALPPLLHKNASQRKARGGATAALAIGPRRRRASRPHVGSGASDWAASPRRGGVGGAARLVSRRSVKPRANVSGAGELGVSSSATAALRSRRAPPARPPPRLPLALGQRGGDGAKEAGGVPVRSDSDFSAGKNFILGRRGAAGHRGGERG